METVKLGHYIVRLVQEHGPFNSQEDIVKGLKKHYNIDTTAPRVNNVMCLSRKDPTIFGGVFSYGQKGYADSFYRFIEDGAAVTVKASDQILRTSFAGRDYALSMAESLKTLFERHAAATNDPVRKAYYLKLVAAEDVVVIALRNVA